MIKTDTASALGRILCTTVLLGILLLTSGRSAPPLRADQAPLKGETVAYGEFFCAVQTPVIMPFSGSVLSLAFQPGQPIRKADPIFRYRIDSKEVLGLHHRFSRLQTGDMEIRMLEVDEALLGLQQQQEELEMLRQRQLAPEKRLDEIKRKIELLVRKKQIMEKNLREQWRIAQQERHNMGLELGLEHDPDQVPAEALLRAPLAGHIIWLSPKLREGAIIARDTHVAQIGIMNPMAIRAQVHEIEAAGIRPGDPAEVHLEAIPDRTFQATVQRVPWAPMQSGLNKPTYYEVELSVANPDLLIKDGFKGQVRFLPVRQNTVK